MSKPIAAARSSSRVAVANVPCTGRPSSSQPPVERGKNSYQAPASASERSTWTWWVSPSVTSSRTGYSVMVRCTGTDSASPTRSGSSRSVSRSSAAAFVSVRGEVEHRGHRDAARALARGVVLRDAGGVAQALLDAVGRPLEQAGPGLEVVGQLGGALAGPRLDVDGVAPRRPRVAPRVDAEAPQALDVGDHLAGEPVGQRARRHHARAPRGLVAARDRGVGVLPVAPGGAALPDQGRRDGVVALAPDRRLDRDDLADDGLRREPPAGDLRRDLVDPDPALRQGVPVDRVGGDGGAGRRGGGGGLRRRGWPLSWSCRGSWRARRPWARPRAASVAGAPAGSSAGTSAPSGSVTVTSPGASPPRRSVSADAGVSAAGTSSRGWSGASSGPGWSAGWSARSSAGSTGSGPMPRGSSSSGTT